jgi:hypothetical protein
VGASVGSGAHLSASVGASGPVVHAWRASCVACAPRVVFVYLKQ